MFCTTRTFAVIFAAVLSPGCFIDGSGDGSSETASTGETGDSAESGGTTSPTTAGTITQTATSPVTGVSATTLTDTTSSTTQDPTTDGESGPTDSDSDTDTTDTTSADTGTSSSTGDDVLTVSELVAGDLVITEVMANPNCLGDNCEWFELSNTTQFDIDLLNLGIGDRDDYDNEAPGTFITVSAVLPAGELGIIAREDLWPYDEEPLARYSNAVQFSNTSFERVVVFSGVDVLDVTATFLPNDQPGRSRMLLSASWDSEDHTDSDDWCWSNTVLPSTSTSDDWGTPGNDTIDCLPPA